eukprot:CAMPEP_0178969076 /NCGR_PEP_ID=MMETSP0789-20121207/18630_1 /TAXON_ID=3005 /ORGANISM="Rhizosolenia setigera, Strain CCMP 1694" /LENGTH=211 /DNA_ID=CAMNT_0020655119 /DNA_START=23 /DNA_END=654 /DNA_ORIENTATION=-
MCLSACAIVLAPLWFPAMMTFIYLYNNNNNNETGNDDINNNSTALSALMKEFSIWTSPPPLTTTRVRASCSARIETSNVDIFDYVVEDEEPEQKVSKVFQQTVNDILSDTLIMDLESSSTQKIYSPSSSTTTTQNDADNSFSSNNSFDVFFTLSSKEFSCDDGDCDTTLMEAQKFVDDAINRLDSDSFDSVMMAQGSLSGVQFMEKHSRMT